MVIGRIKYLVLKCLIIVQFSGFGVKSDDSIKIKALTALVGQLSLSVC